MKLSAKGVDESAVDLELDRWHNERRRKESGRRVPSQRKLRRLKRQAAFRRNNATRAERMLFKALNGGKLFGTNWRRQHVVDDLIADLYCRTARLIVEIHPDGRKWSRQGDVDYLNSQGFAVLRFSESEVVERPEWVLELIRGTCHKQLRLASRRGKAGEEAQKAAGEKSAQPVEPTAQAVETFPSESLPPAGTRTRWSRTRETVSSFLRAWFVSGESDHSTTRISIEFSRRSEAGRVSSAPTTKRAR